MLTRMKGHDQVVTALNDVLTAELTAVNQYFVHARMCENWGYERLWKKVRAESIGEMRHADTPHRAHPLSRRHPQPAAPGQDQRRPDRLRAAEADLEVEKTGGQGAQHRHRALPQPGRQRQPRVLERMLVSEEGHANWLEAQLTLIAAGGRGQLSRAADPGRRRVQ